MVTKLVSVVNQTAATFVSVILIETTSVVLLVFPM